MIPSPPDLKPTIIQMQNDNVNDESAISDRAEAPSTTVPCSADDDKQGKKKRRRSSSSLASQNEIEKRRREHKTAHSIIEKKRRIRMNREFEALKFLVPACRNNLNTSNNNGEGMYKLTILQATVDYIRYLHSVINIQDDELQKLSPDWEDEDLDFAKVDVSTEEYRNLDNDFSFNQLFDQYNSERSSLSSDLPTSSTTTDRSHSNSMPHPTTYPNRSFRPSEPTLRLQHSNSLPTDPLSQLQSLPSPIITPELYPRTATKSNTLDITNYKTQPFKQDFQFPLAKPSPVMIQDSSSKGLAVRGAFELPSSALDDGEVEEERLESIQESHGVETEESATKALLSMKTDGSVTSIRSLLN